MRYLIFIFSTVLFAACGKSGGSGAGTTTPTGNNDSVLVNIGANIILPAYQGLAGAVNALDSAIGDFNAAPTAGKLTNVQSLFKSAYLDWEATSGFDYLGPASTAQPVLATLNIFPTSAKLIDSNVSVNNDNVNTFANTVAKGFPALDYLLFGAGANTLANYTSDPAAPNRQKYLAAVSADLRTEVNGVLNGWASYLNTFETGTGNSVSSSLGLLLNSMDQDFEILKNDRLGIPLGLIPVGVVSPVLPKEVEAYYSGISVQLALAQAQGRTGAVSRYGSKRQWPGFDQLPDHCQSQIQWRPDERHDQSGFRVDHNGLASRSRSFITDNTDEHHRGAGGLYAMPAAGGAVKDGYAFRPGCTDHLRRQ